MSSASTLVVAPSSAESATPAPTLPPASAKLTTLLDEAVIFLVAGEEGRLGVLEAKDGAIVPRIFDGGAWATIALSEAHRAAATDPVGIFFGRDDRPRLMGHRRDAGTMIYLRFKDGRWKEEPSEIGQLAAADAKLFGILGEADPEVVCRAGVLCLVKSRKGWQETKPTVPVDAVWRVFHGRGYAATAKAVFRTEGKGFVQIGPDGLWETPPQGFFVSSGGNLIVTEPARATIHTFVTGESAWRTEPSPIDAPRDVVIDAQDERVVVGDGGIARTEGRRYRRVGEPSLRLSRAIVVDTHVVVGGASGVFRLK